MKETTRVKIVCVVAVIFVLLLVYGGIGLGFMTGIIK